MSNSPATVQDLLQLIGEQQVQIRMQRLQLESVATELRRLQARNAELEPVPENEDPPS